MTTTPQRKSVEEVADDFRKQFDELRLKSLKQSMQNMERELIRDFWRNSITIIKEVFKKQS